MKRITLLLLLFGQSLCLAEDVMFLNTARIGKSVQSTEALLAMSSTNAVAPSKVTLELKGTTVVGVLIEYPKRITQQMVRNSLNSKFAQAERKFSTDNVYAWRDKERKISMLVGNEKGKVILIVRSIDGEVLKGNTKEIK